MDSSNLRVGGGILHRLNWDDLRFVLAVAESGSVAAAARALSVNHATVLRRIASFEEITGGPVFERSAAGYRLRPDRAAVIELAREAAKSFGQIETLMRGQTGEGRLLRMTSVDTLCQTVLAENYGRIARRMAPDHVVLLSGNAHLDISRLQADVAVRPTRSLPEDMVGEQACAIGMAAYATVGAPTTWLGVAGQLAAAPPGQWLADNVDPSDITGSADSYHVLRVMAEAGQGRVILPCILGDASNKLVRLPDAMPHMALPIWVLSHRDLAGNSRIETLRSVICSTLKAQADRLHG